MTEPIYGPLRNDVPRPRRRICGANLHPTLFSVSVRRMIHSPCGIWAPSRDRRGKKTSFRWWTSPHFPLIVVMICSKWFFLNNISLVQLFRLIHTLHNNKVWKHADRTDSNGDREALVWFHYSRKCVGVVCFRAFVVSGKHSLCVGVSSWERVRPVRLWASSSVSGLHLGGPPEVQEAIPQQGGHINTNQAAPRTTPSSAHQPDLLSPLDMKRTHHHLGIRTFPLTRIVLFLVNGLRCSKDTINISINIRWRGNPRGTPWKRWGAYYPLSSSATGGWGGTDGESPWACQGKKCW